MKQIAKKINFKKVAEVLFAITLMLAPFGAYALTGPDCTTLNGINCDTTTDLNAFIVKIINYLLAITLAIDVLFLIIGGFMYITSAGNEERATKGKNTVLNALIGLVIIIMAYVIANVVAGFFSKTAPTN